MEFAVSNVFRALAYLFIAVTGACMISGLAFAQAQLTPEQMRAINQLPPAQRQQAMGVLRQLQSKRESSSEVSSTSEKLTRPLRPEDLTDDTGLDVAASRRAEGRSRLIIDLIPLETLLPEDVVELKEDPVLTRITGTHYYELDEFGVLELPGLEKIPLLGLSDGTITRRLSAETDLRFFRISVTLLDSESVGAEALLPFGYDVFEPREFGFEPVTAGPVPPDYVLGPGDSIRVQLFGNVSGIYELEVSREGVLNLPQLGPITVAGLSFSEFRADLKNRVREMLIGTQVSISMGALRTIRVFVLGDANRPGSYVISSMSTISSALYRSGGISEVGTLRNIQLKRQGRTVATLDLYDLLLKGDTSGDVRLQPSDVIFVPPIGETVGVAGAVSRPAIYELRGHPTVMDVIALAGGMRPDAFPSGATLEHISEDRNRVILSVDLDSPDGANVPVAGGDVLLVPEVLAELNDSVTLAGFAQRPGPYQWRPGMRLTDLVASPLALRPGADSSYILIRRASQADRSVSVKSADLSAAFSDPKSVDNIELYPRDTVHVFGLAFGRQRVITPIMEELQLQARFGDPSNKVRVSGAVRAPGAYPLEPGMRISDLVRAGGSMGEQAFGLEAELTRFSVVDGERRAREIIDIDLRALLTGSEHEDLILTSHDHLRIDLLPDWNTDWSVTLEGEVRFPGEYQILRGETLRQVIGRAGGLTDYAFRDGAIFLRKSLKEREREQIEILARRMESDLATLSLETLDTTGAEALGVGQSLLDQLRNVEPVGRLVIGIDLLPQGAGNESTAHDIELQNGDRLLIPTMSQEITVIGETQHPTSHVYRPGLVRDDYIALSGGLTRKADKKLIYVVRASGAVISSSRSKWFGRGAKAEIRPGDTIVVPLETDRIRPLTFWTNVTQILYQSALAVAAIRTFNN